MSCEDRKSNKTSLDVPEYVIVLSSVVGFFRSIRSSFEKMGLPD